ncbi:neurogenic locus Notch protein-like [Protopterus annectens]|uniref:neurogenic locus Notch protein-like n=1 Tax=Protopterus annectens TaxID=7888 RepID=UPI001CFA8789|nr:neurogenic locus Notch protein-like [Protopterus annectens]
MAFKCLWIYMFLLLDILQNSYGQKTGCAGPPVMCCKGTNSKCKPAHVNCFCDETCEKFNQCCSDYASTCKKDPINGCLSSPCSPYATCTSTSTAGDYKCTCKSGFTGIGTICEDINECDLKICSSNATCENTIGGYKCSCNPGFSGNGATCSDINECENHICSPDANCTNTVGGYNCSCKPGFSGNGTSCRDINECLQEKNPCGSDYLCINTFGNYTCTRLPATTPTPIGCLSDKGLLCCEGLNDSCRPANAACYCDSACSSSTHDCCFDYNATCMNASYNACLKSPCSPNATCTRLYYPIGGYNCTCKAGFTGNGTVCTDIDECAKIICPGNLTCVNTPGSYSCSCKKGFSANGNSCIDINECTSTSVCPVNSVCMNTPGSYSCLCSSGYTGNGATCTDINECANSKCSPNAICTNTPGNYSCQCKYGYTGSGTSCQSLRDSAVSLCDSGSSCTNALGCFMCSNTVGSTTSQVCCKQLSCPSDLCLGIASCTIQRPDQSRQCVPSCSSPYNIGTSANDGYNFNPNPLPDVPMRSIRLKVSITSSDPSFYKIANINDYNNFTEAANLKLSSILSKVNPAVFVCNQNVQLKNESGTIYAYADAMFYYQNKHSVITTLNSDLQNIINGSIAQSVVKAAETSAISINGAPLFTELVKLSADQLKPFYNCSSSGYNGYVLNFDGDVFQCISPCSAGNYCSNQAICEHITSGPVCRCKPVSIYSPFGERCENLALNLNAFFGILFGALAFLFLLLLIIFIIICCVCKKRKSETLPVETPSNHTLQSEKRNSIYDSKEYTVSNNWKSPWIKENNNSSWKQ